MRTFVLVHGAMHGGWCWRAVADRLTEAGHTVRTPTLTGQGERVHLASPEVGVDTHVADVLGVLEYDDLHDVHLVLHSYAGILAGPVVDHSGGRVTRVSFLGAFLADPGECLLDVEPPETAARYRSLAAEQGDGWRIPASPAFLDQWGVTDPAQRDQVGPRLTDFLLRCTTEPVTFPARALDAVACAYVQHTDPPLASLDRSIARARARGWPVVDVACGHDLMLAAPDRTVEVLTRLDGGVVGRI